MLLDNISATEVWRPLLFTVEIGARGLVGLSTHKTFVRLGFTSSQAKALCELPHHLDVKAGLADFVRHVRSAAKETNLESRRARDQV